MLPNAGRVGCSAGLSHADRQSQQVRPGQPRRGLLRRNALKGQMAEGEFRELLSLLTRLHSFARTDLDEIVPVSA